MMGGRSVALLLLLAIPQASLADSDAPALFEGDCHACSACVDCMAGGKLGCEDCDASGRCFDCKQCFGLCQADFCAACGFEGAPGFDTDTGGPTAPSDGEEVAAPADAGSDDTGLFEGDCHACSACVDCMAGGKLGCEDCDASGHCFDCKQCFGLCQADFCAACGFEGAPGFDPAAADSAPAHTPAHPPFPSHPALPNHTAASPSHVSAPRAPSHPSFPAGAPRAPPHPSFPARPTLGNHSTAGSNNSASGPHNISLGGGGSGSAFMTPSTPHLSHYGPSSPSAAAATAAGGEVGADKWAVGLVLVVGAVAVLVVNAHWRQWGMDRRCYTPLPSAAPPPPLPPRASYGATAETL